MRKLLLIGGLAFGLLMPASSASAAPVRDCGDDMRRYSAIHNVTTRNHTCGYAMRVARQYGWVHFIKYGRTFKYRHGRYSCR